MTDIPAPLNVALNGGKGLLSIDSHTTEDGELVLGGELLCRDAKGNFGVALRASCAPANASVPTSGEVVINNGSLRVVDTKGKQVGVVCANANGIRHGGALMLGADNDLSGPTPSGNPLSQAIVLDAATRSITINSAGGQALLRLSGDRVLLIASTADGQPLAKLDTTGALTLGGGSASAPGLDGDLVLRDKMGAARVQISGDEPKLTMSSDIGTTFEIGQSGNIEACGSISSNGTVSATGSVKASKHLSANGNLDVGGNAAIKGTLVHQDVKQRHRNMNVGADVPLFSTNQNGAFVVEFVATFAGERNGQMVRFSGYQRYVVFTHKNNIAPLLRYEICVSESIVGGGTFTANHGLRESDGSIRFRVGSMNEHAITGYSGARILVRALYGTLFDF